MSRIWEIFPNYKSLYKVLCRSVQSVQYFWSSRVDAQSRTWYLLVGPVFDLPRVKLVPDVRDQEDNLEEVQPGVKEGVIPVPEPLEEDNAKKTPVLLNVFLVTIILSGHMYSCWSPAL